MITRISPDPVHTPRIPYNCNFDISGASPDTTTTELLREAVIMSGRIVGCVGPLQDLGFSPNSADVLVPLPKKCLVVVAVMW